MRKLECSVHIGLSRCGGCAIPVVIVCSTIPRTIVLEGIQHRSPEQEVVCVNIRWDGFRYDRDSIRPKLPPIGRAWRAAKLLRARDAPECYPEVDIKHQCRLY